MSAHTTIQPRLQIIHFNDVYNIDTTPRDPVGGAARFVTAVRQAKEVAQPLETLVLFSGDAFSPAPLTGMTGGKEIPPVLNAVGVDVACVGNHDLDGGVEVLKSRVGETEFPWLLSNVKMPDGGAVGGVVEEVVVIERGGFTIGFMGLAGGDWSQCLEGGVSMVQYEDYVQCARRLGGRLKAQGCDFVIALTHMRQPDDDRLAREVDVVDLILGGHDHVLRADRVGAKWVVKSGTDFKNFSTMQVGVEDNWGIVTSAPVHHQVTSAVKEDPEMAKFVAQQLEALGDEYKKVLAVTDVHLDGRFLSIRTQETALGSLVCDIVAQAMDSKIAMINAGSFRADAVELPGKITQQTLGAILPFTDYAVLTEYTGRHVLRVLEHGVGKYPTLHGRFLQVSGIKFKFDPQQPEGSRVVPSSVEMLGTDDLYRPLELDAVYRVAVKAFINDGNDGYPQGDKEKIINQSGCPMAELVRRYFETLAEEQGKDEGEEAALPTIAPKTGGRIVCVNPDRKLQKAYVF